MIATASCYPAAARPGLVSAGWLALHAPRRSSLPQTTVSATVRRQHALPRAERVLTVTARPGQESADLGALLYTFGRVGARVALLSLTRGEASRLNSTVEPLQAVRPWELRVAAHVLGVSSVAVADYPDGSLSSCGVTELTERVNRAITDQSADLVLITDPSEGGLDDAIVAMAACDAARAAGVPALARTVSAATGGWQVDLGDHAAQARAAQRSAVAAHASQSGALADLTVRLQLLGRSEWLRWLVPPAAPWPLLD
jgi:LmbE family N-acetylglucosaminyl deacetylase